MISTSYDPWIVPSLDQVDYFDDVMFLNPIEQAYQATIFASAAASIILPLVCI